jgi:hypothetical protein
MEQLSVKDALDIMQSDMKLWERAEKNPVDGGGVALSLHLPWGIGLYTVNLEGMGDAKGRRNALGAYGEHIRGVIKERIDDESITSRAKSAAARSEQDDRRDSPRNDRVPEPTGPATTPKGPRKAHRQTSSALISDREALIAERIEVVEAIKSANEDIRRWERELRIIKSVLSIMEEDDAPENSRPTTTGDDGPSEDIGS